MRSKFVEVDGTAVNYLHSGTSTLPGQRPPLDVGELILFVHGAGANAQLWRKQIELLGERHSVVAVDLPGHGRSGGTEALGSAEAYSRFLSSFVESLELRPLVLVGKGLGASVALHFAAAEPKRARGVVAIASALKVSVAEDTLKTWHDVMRGRAPQPFSKDEFSSETPFEVMREVWMEQVRTDPRVRYHDLQAWGAADLSDVVSEVRQPVLIVAGSDDNVVPASASQELCPLLPNARVELVDKAGHALEVEQAKALAEKIDHFVGSIDHDRGARA